MTKVSPLDISHLASVDFFSISPSSFDGIVICIFFWTGWAENHVQIPIERVRFPNNFESREETAFSAILSPKAASIYEFLNWPSFHQYSNFLLTFVWKKLYIILAPHTWWITRKKKIQIQNGTYPISIQIQIFFEYVVIFKLKFTLISLLALLVMVIIFFSFLGWSFIRVKTFGYTYLY